MLKSRSGLILAALLLCACDHHKQVDSSQAAAGAAATGQTDSEYTGMPAPATNVTVYPRALPVVETNTPPQTATASFTPSPDTNTPTSSPQAAAPPVVVSSPPAGDNPSVPPAPATADTSSAATPPAAGPSADTGPASDRLAINTPNPVAASVPAAATEEQVVVIDTTMGRIVIETDDNAAPKTSANFRKLAANGFYNQTIFHRVIPHFIIQGGDPNSHSGDRSRQGLGGPGYTLPPEISLKHERGAVAMARLPDSVNPGRESNGSQFYICVVDSPSLDNQYTVFGHVIKGMDVVDAISNLSRDKRDNPINRIEMEVTLEPKEQALSESSAASP